VQEVLLWMVEEKMMGVKVCWLGLILLLQIEASEELCSSLLNSM